MQLERAIERNDFAGLAFGVILGLGQVFIEEFQVLWEFDSFEEVLVELFSSLQLLHVHHLGVAQQFFHLGPLLLAVRHQLGNERAKLLTIGTANFLVLTHHDLLEKFVRRVCAERWPEHSHFVEHAAQRPDVAFVVIGLLVPHFRRGVVGCARLGDCELIDQVFGHIQVAHLRNALVEENVGRLDVSVDDVGLMQLGQSLQHVVGHSPDLLLGDATLEGLRLFDLSLNGQDGTCRSPSLAYSITMHSISVLSS